jgi:phosphoglycolate phosphatase-like HAD superfamily hydrolase
MCVLPSLRLKRLRRGVEDSGLLALATLELGPEKVASMVRRLVPAAFDELGAGERSRFDFDPVRHAELRSALRRAAPTASPERSELDESLRRLRVAIADRGPTARPSALRVFFVYVGLPLALFALAAAGIRLGILARRR